MDNTGLLLGIKEEKCCTFVLYIIIYELCMVAHVCHGISMQRHRKISVICFLPTVLFRLLELLIENYMKFKDDD